MAHLFPPGRILVFGSFPPVPGLASDATVAVLRDAWDGGAEVVTVSPRAAAADRVARVSGLLGGHRLDVVRKLSGSPERVVLGIEAGIPVAVRPGPTPRWRVLPDALAGHLAVRALIRTLARFDHVTVVLSGPTGVRRALLGPLWSRVDAVLVTAAGASEARRLGVPGDLVAPLDVTTGSVANPAVTVPGVAVPGVAVPGVAVPGVAVPGVAVPGVAAPVVTALGPREVEMRDTPLWVAGWAGRRLLGRRFYAYRFFAIRAVRKIARTVRARSSTR